MPRLSRQRRVRGLAKAEAGQQRTATPTEQRSAATGLYVVYNDTEGFSGLGPVNRRFILKYSHMFDVLR